MVTSIVPGILLAFNKHLLNIKASAVGVEGSVLSGCSLSLWWILMLTLPSWMEESSTAGDLVGLGHAMA